MRAMQLHVYTERMHALNSRRGNIHNKSIGTREQTEQITGTSNVE